MTTKRQLDALAARLERHAGRRAATTGREWTAAGAVHQEPEHVAEVLRVLRDAGALELVLVDDELRQAALELLADYETA